MSDMDYCPECRKMTTYTTAVEQIADELKGELYEYTAKLAYCDICGEEMDIPAYHDANLEALYDAYRVKNGILPLAMVKEIPEKYKIGIQPLSLALGFGEKTFARYYDGAVPSKKYSDMLKSVHEEPAVYEALLEENKDKISAKAYHESRATVDQLIQSAAAVQGAAVDSAIERVCEYLIDQCGDITQLALQKALYYIQGFTKAFTGKFIFAEDCEAWVHGPVYREIYEQYKSYRYDPIQIEGARAGVGVGHFDASVFSSAEKSVIDSVIQHLCCYSGRVLENFTHAETPWLVTRDDVPGDAPSERVIDKQLIADYFTQVKQKYGMLVPMDIRDYALHLFNDLRR